MRKQFKDIERKKTSKVWSTSTSQPVSLPICVVRTV